MEWYKGVWCVTMDELTRDDRTEATNLDYLAPILSKANYDAYVKRGKLSVARRGGGASCPALIDYKSLPEDIRKKVDMKYPDMEAMQSRADKASYKVFREAYVEDMKAYSYYIDRLNELKTETTNERLTKLAKEYAVNASVIQAVLRLKREATLYRKVRQGRKTSWAEMSEAIRFYKEEYGHTLGLSPARFAQWVRRYESEGYGVLISKKFGNMNTLKASVQVEKLLMELAYDKHRPYDRTVWEWYCAFLRGEMSYYNKTTGEMYDPADYPDLSEKTVNEILKTRLNQARLSKRHDALHDYKTGLRPYNKREKPKYSLSMVSLDDKDFGIKIHWTKEMEVQDRGRKVMKPVKVVTALKAYICYDVASECAIGWAFSGEKDTDIFERCIRSMYCNLLAWGLGQPYEAQVENHIVSLYKEGMMKSGTLFPEVSFAGAENSQEKYAEHYNRMLKYQFEKYMVDIAIGRPHAKTSANRTKGFTAHRDKEGNICVKDFAEACRLYDSIIEAYNNAPHSKQKLYKGLSRKDALLQCVHPEIQPINLVQMARWAGYATKTSVVRGMLRANYMDYSVSPEAQERLKGRKGRVTAHYLPDEAGEVNEVYLFQEDVFLEVCPRIVPYQVSKLERTAEDMRKLGRQQARVRAWDKAVEQFTPEGLGNVEADTLAEIEASEVQIVPPLPKQKEDSWDSLADDWANLSQDYAKRAIADL